MSRFYARYISPTKKAEVRSDDDAEASPNLNKRKREENTPKQVNKESKKSKSHHDVADAPAEMDTPQKPNGARESSHTTGKGLLKKYRVTATAKSGESSVKLRHERSNGFPQYEDESAEDARKYKHEKKEGKRKKSKLSGEQSAVTIKDAAEVDDETSLSRDVRRDEDQNDGPSDNKHVIKSHKREKREKTKAERIGEGHPEEGQDSIEAQKHAGVLAKFEKAKQQDPPDRKRDVVREEEPLELHGLEPLPQPAQSETVPQKLTYSFLPPWQENPVVASSQSGLDFDSCGLSLTLISNMRKNGLEHALPVQATVLPLLLDGPTRHAGDLCVSAATGSGKTLSYVLPIIADLQELPGTRLRAVIVVPTRELVKQVRELCETCSAGLSLKFATAVGSKSLTDEQDMLVQEEQTYDPEEYEKWQRAPIDWSSFSLAKLAQTMKDQDPLESVGYMTRYTSKVDVLVTTPGRLVDHLRSTSGFTLDHVRWLVVDEADRLLNESYQEWVAAVKPALESQAATRKRDELLKHMRMTPPRRKVTKVLLSATMTRDLAKLNALGLYNPKLVVLEGNKEDDMKMDQSNSAVTPLMGTNSTEAFHLPETLEEVAIPISDGSEKPLFLLELVENHLGMHQAPSHSISAVRLDSTPRSDSTSGSDSSSESSSSSSDDESSSPSESSPVREETSLTEETTESKLMEGRQDRKGPRALIFTRSTASAERLFRLMCLLDPLMAPRIATLTRSTASSASSRRALASFRGSRISILIATDRASRGLDVPDLEHVVSYDVPNSALTYVHRVGRTARAGKGGQAWTFVEHREGAWFWREIGGKRKQPASGTAANEITIQRIGKVNKLQISLEDRALKERYKEALNQLGDEVLGRQS